jgi:hypothetical protein
VENGEKREERLNGEWMSNEKIKDKEWVEEDRIIEYTWKCRCRCECECNVKKDKETGKERKGK